MSRGAVRVPQPVYLLCCKYGVCYNSWPNDNMSFMQFHTSPANFVATSYLCAVFSFCVGVFCLFFFAFCILRLCVCVAKTVVLTQERVDVQQAATREALWFLTRLLTQVLSFKGLYLLISPTPPPPPAPLS